MSFALLLALAPPKEPPVPIAPEHLAQSTTALWLGAAAIGLFFVLRPELWKRLWLERIDPRGPALARMAVGLTAVWTYVDLAVLGKFLFTDEGLFLTSLARKNYGGQLTTLWDPEHGFEDLRSVLKVFEGRWTILHLRSDPPFVWSIFAATFVSGLLMTVGKWTRLSTFLTWVLVNQLANYSPIWYAGGDTVLRVMLFLGMFVGWGEAYSLDCWRRRRRAILRGATSLPPLRRIVAWPVRLMMLQLAIIYCATGLLKSGGTWWNGSALYYAMNLDHFYRYPAPGLVTVMHYSGLLPLGTWVVHWWEMLFPLALVGVAVHAYVRDRDAGIWPKVARWRSFLSWSLLVHLTLVAAFLAGLTAFYYYEGRYLGLRDDLITKAQARWIASGTVLGAAVLPVALVLVVRRYPRARRFGLNWGLGKRSWLTLGALFHLGIEASMNVGTFVQVMWATYPAWLRGGEVDAFWRYLQSRPAAPGEGSRPPLAPADPKRKPRRLAGLIRRVSGAYARLRHRVPRAPYLVHHALDEASLRRAALLRCWDVSHRLSFVAAEDAVPGELSVTTPRSTRRLVGDEAARALVRVFPGLWPLWPVAFLPGAGALARVILHQR